MQVLNPLGHAMGGAGSGGADLQNAAMHLHVKRQNMTAKIGQHTMPDERVPERRGMFWPDLSLVGAGEAVDGMDWVMTHHQFMPRIGVLFQYLTEPLGFDVTLAAETGP
jgi:hypothetical protein